MGWSTLLTESLKQGLVLPQSMTASLGSALQSVLVCTADNVQRIDRSSLNISLCLEQSFAEACTALGRMQFFIASALAVRMRRKTSGTRPRTGLTGLLLGGLW